MPKVPVVQVSEISQGWVCHTMKLASGKHTTRCAVAPCCNVAAMMLLTSSSLAREGLGASEGAL